MARSGYWRSYRGYLLLRGYDPDASKWAILKRALLESWAQPGFHRFWQVWNPGVGYLLLRLYLLLRGRRRRRTSAATVGVFVVCGLLHDIAVMLMFRRPFVAFSCAFACLGLLTVVSRRSEPWLRQGRWPALANAVANVSLVAVSVHAGVTLQRALLS